MLEDKRFRTESQQALPEFNLPLISHQSNVIPKYLNPATFERLYYVSLCLCFNFACILVMRLLDQPPY
jgi:hypothetical protein